MGRFQKRLCQGMAIKTVGLQLVNGQLTVHILAVRRHKELRDNAASIKIRAL